jgi:hypothetical protein
MAVEVRIPTLAGGLIKSSTVFSFVVAFSPAVGRWPRPKRKQFSHFKSQYEKITEA